MKYLLKLSFAMIFASFLFSSCVTTESPMGPEEPEGGDDDNEVVINTPTALKISAIIVTRFPATKSNGDKWDYHVFSSSPTRRPDIYVEMGKNLNTDHVYRSETREDVLFESFFSKLTFTQPAASNGGSLAHNIPFNTEYIIWTYDDDGLSADDLMGSVQIDPSAYYNDDNATFVYERLSNGELTIEIEGRWIY